ncbi:hypothetical protein F4680DRAFT_145149 [Xylaria scruposa]|nr:hypothetical protein F4680DRAFT_145149 [Xylaria scruposa]
MARLSLAIQTVLNQINASCLDTMRPCTKHVVSTALGILLSKIPFLSVCSRVVPFEAVGFRPTAISRNDPAVNATKYYTKSTFPRQTWGAWRYI